MPRQRAWTFSDTQRSFINSVSGDFPTVKDIPMDKLDPARTALVVVHTVKGVAGEVDAPFNRIVRRRAEEKGLMGVQKRLLDGFRSARRKARKWSTPRSRISPVTPGSRGTPGCSAR